MIMHVILRFIMYTFSVLNFMLPHAHPILLKFPARHKRLSGPVTETRRRGRRSGFRIPVRAGRRLSSKT